MRALLAALCLLLPAVGAAADLLPVEDFAKHAQLSLPRLSPDGQYLALRVDDDGGQHSLVVYKISDMSAPVSMLKMPKYELPASFYWVSTTRLVIMKGQKFGSLDRPVLTGEIIATDVNGKHQDYLYGYQGGGSRGGTRNHDEGYAEYDGRPEPANNHFYMTTHAWNADRESSLYDVDATANKRLLIGNIGVADMDFMVGADGKAHFAYGINNDYKYVVYHREGNGWGQMNTAEMGRSFVPLDFTPDHQRIYATYALEGGPTALVEEDENGGNRKFLAKDDSSSIGGIEWTALPHRPFATVPATGLPKVSYIDPNMDDAKLHMALSLKFPGESVHFINYSEDGGQLLFGISSDRDPGAYYLIDTHTYKVRKLFDVAPWIDPAKMAERRPLRFKASSGNELEAILTFPKGAPEKNLPMVLLPHGGPIGVQDDWHYDNEAQFLANRGYLVLQVNFRGSSGRGNDFIRAGYRQWGTGIQQDLIDGVKWAIGEKYADPNRICVFGGSFGGYSAMMAVIRAPGMFKCAVGYAGIYDMAMRYTKGDTQESELGRNALRVEMGDDPADLAANSPDKLADQINVPVFLIHGEDDQRAPFAQAKAMRAALDAAHKQYEWMSKPGEGHGFYDEKNNIELYTRLQAFLEKYIGKGA
ncbi:alpha/beta hydrolase family protein [Rhodanobacter sp. BL-MT-08]